MIERILWPHNARAIFGELTSPFSRGDKERSIRITFHNDSFGNLSGEEAEALEALRELSYLPDIQALGTAHDNTPRITIRDYQIEDDYVPITIEAENKTTETFVDSPSHIQRIAAHILGEQDVNHPDVQVLLADIIVAQAHHKLGHDILITMSSNLLRHRSHPIIRETNPRSPLEAVKIVSLFLRSRDNFTWSAGGHWQRAFNRGLFYLILTRHRLPNMWYYQSACQVAENVRNDDIAYLGGSILTRCRRALEARDAIGMQFYLPQNNGTRDTITYHFDYLTLLLTGAFDAQARVAYRVYRITRPTERYSSFRNRDFLNALSSQGANNLHHLVTTQHFRDVTTLLYELRNTIHGAGLPALAVERAVEPQESYVTVLPEYAQTVWDAAERCGSASRWGLVRIHGLRLEPYTFVTTLVQESLSLIDAIAAATDVNLLFPGSVSPQPLLNGPPNDENFGVDRRRRVDIIA